MNATADRQYLINAIANYKVKSHPGFPVAKMPLSVAPTMRAMIAAGEIQQVDVTKPSAADPSRTVTHSYLRLI